MNSAPEWVEIAKGVAAVAQVIAVVVGGTWAYFKFVRGRTFSKRLELAVEGVLIGRDNDYAVIVTASLRNPGLAVVALSETAKSTYLYGLAATDWLSDASVEWGTHLRVTPLFEEHEWIEAEEVITDRVLVPVPAPTDPSGTWLAFLVTAIVARSPGTFRKGLAWNAATVVPCGFVPVHDAAGHDPDTERKRAR
jgi:hypothetical protein